MKNLYIISYLILLTILGCNQSSENFNDIISKFDQVNIEGFEGYGIYQRGKDNKGNSLIYVSKTLNSDTFKNSGNVIVGIDPNGRVQFTDSKFVEFNLNMDTVIQAALFLKSLNINGLSIDYEGKAFIFIYGLEYPQLMKSPKNGNYIGWERINNSWYRNSG